MDDEISIDTLFDIELQIIEDNNDGSLQFAFMGYLDLKGYFCVKLYAKFFYSGTLLQYVINAL